MGKNALRQNGALQDQPLLVDVIVKLAINWGIRKRRAEKLDPQIRHLQQRLASANTELKSVWESLADENKDLRIEILASHPSQALYKQLQAQIDSIEDSPKRQHCLEEYDDHPFIPFCGHVARLTGWKKERVMQAALVNFNGHRLLVEKLRQLDETGSTIPLYRQLLRKHRDLATIIGLNDVDIKESNATVTKREAAQTTRSAAGPPAGFVPLTTVYDKVGSDYAKAKRTIKSAKIPTWKPTPKSRRLYVDAAAWVNHFNAEKPPDDPAIEGFMAGMAERKAGINKRPGRKLKTLQ